MLVFSFRKLDYLILYVKSGNRVLVICVKTENEAGLKLLLQQNSLKVPSYL